MLMQRQDGPWEVAANRKATGSQNRNTEAEEIWFICWKDTWFPLQPFARLESKEKTNREEIATLVVVDVHTISKDFRCENKKKDLGFWHESKGGNILLSLILQSKLYNLLIRKKQDISHVRYFLLTELQQWKRNSEEKKQKIGMTLEIQPCKLWKYIWASSKCIVKLLCLNIREHWHVFTHSSTGFQRLHQFLSLQSGTSVLGLEDKDWAVIKPGDKTLNVFDFVQLTKNRDKI